MSTLGIKAADDIVELELKAPPCNEIGWTMLDALEGFLPELARARALVIHSSLDTGFCAGADLRELYREMQGRDDADREVRAFLERIHAVFNTIDAAPIPTFAAIHGVCFGGGFELALCCDVIVADKTARFCFPELRLGLIPGFGGIPRLQRDCGNGLIRDLLLTGRSINALRAHQAGIVSQLVGEGHALRAARAAAVQSVKFDAEAAAAAKRFAKPIPGERLREEIDLFVGLFRRPNVEESLRRFVESDDIQPYLP
jgi:enoyl-CoA hydratase/carnithine racemase